MLRIFVNTWGNYNKNGADGGEWLELPMDPNELTEKLDAIAEAMGDKDPEWAIHDYEWIGDIDIGEIGEYDGIEEWNDKCMEADDLEDYELVEIAAAIEAWGYSFEEAMERQQRGCFVFYEGQSLEDVAYQLVEECYNFDNVPEIFSRYFDYEAFARDLRFDGYEETSLGVILDD